MLPYKSIEDLPKTWQPEEFETPLYDWWEAQGYFQPTTDPDRASFTVPMPPPNITGALHIGHAITAALEDILVRWHRMLGDNTLWLPGTDHASIATHAVVERELAKQGLTRWDLGRDQFEQRVWEWREQYGRRITQQHRRLGASCDWTRERFTLDEVCSRAVREAFKRLHDQGLIYRGEYMVNWCPGCGTAVSDLEVIHQETPGKLWYIKYPLAEGSGYIEVATTRPETMLGDTGVAVNPEDERYRELIGRHVILPLVERRIPIVSDAAVDPAFGTGAVKVTPAHDPTDMEIGRRHNLPLVDIMTPEGTMSEAAGSRYAGMDRFEARTAVVTDLETEGLLSRITDHTHSIGHCQRCDSIAEPRISTQWFVRAEELARPAMDAVREGRIQIIPERFERVYFNWMENIREWCISRQLWWGHRIPVWYCQDCDEVVVAVEDPTSCPKCRSHRLEQDPDVLDTWFSSGLWPFSTLGWPEDTDDLRTFYPAGVLETGYDIIFFWVARMIMMGIAMTGREPFPYVYLHGLIRDEQGRKYSKSLGNALDPLEIIDQYGTDALRYALVTSSTPGNDTKLSLQRIESARNFANKLWNAARFVMSNLPEGMAAPERPVGDGLSLADRWIISRLDSVNQSVDRLLASWQLGEAGRQLQDFLWGDYCDWYIEVSKGDLYGEDEDRRRTVAAVLVYVLERALRLLHPYMPFVTEAIWQYLPHQGDALIVAAWPVPGTPDAAVEEQFGRVTEIIRGIRNVRAEYKVDLGKRIRATIGAGEWTESLRSQAQIISSLARVDEHTLTIEEQVEALPESATVVGSGVVVYLPLAEMVDLEAERERLRKEVADAEAVVTHSRGLLGNGNFVDRAPAAVVERERARCQQAEERLDSLRQRLSELS